MADQDDQPAQPDEPGRADGSGDPAIDQGAAGPFGAAEAATTPKNSASLPSHMSIWADADVDVFNGELDAEMEKLEDLRKRVFALEAGVLPLPAVTFRLKSYARLLSDIDETSRCIATVLRTRLRSAGLSDRQVNSKSSEMAQVRSDIEEYLTELAKWVASCRSQAGSTGQPITDAARLESTPIGLPTRSSDDGVRFLYSFMHTDSVAREGSGQWIRDSTPNPQSAPMPQAASQSSDPATARPLPGQGQHGAAEAYHPPSDPNKRIQTRHPICFSGVTENISSGAAAPTAGQATKTEQAVGSPRLAASVSGAVSTGRGSSDYFSLGPNARQIPKFGGDARRFREWQQLFRVFVDETPAPIIEKFNILRNSLTGKARDAIAHLQWEESHYQLAKEILVERFGDSQLAQSRHIKELDSLLERGVVTFSRLEPFTESLSVNIRALVALGVTFTELSTTTTPRVVRCLPLELRLEFAKSKPASPDRSELERLLELLEKTVKWRREVEWDDRRPQRSRASGFAEAQFRNSRTNIHFSGRDNHSFFAAGQPPRPSKSSQAGPSQSGARPPKHHGARVNASQSSAPAPVVHPPTVPFRGSPLSAAAQAPSARSETQQRSNKSCIFCEAPHESWRCPRVLSHEERLERIQEQNGCVLCLKRNHSSKNCRDGPRSNCPRCNGRHYLIMCRKAQADAASFHIASLPTTSKAIEGGLAAKDEPEVLLKMAVVWLESGDSRCLARVLLDTGAHRSYISSSAVKQVESAPVAAIRTSVKSMGNAITSLDTWLHRVTLRSRHDDTKAITIECIETPSISDSHFPVVSKDMGLSPIADALKGDDSPRLLSIIIGAIDLALIHTGAEKVLGRMLATSSIFGWLFSGTFHESVSVARATALLSETRAALPMASRPEFGFDDSPPSLTTRDFEDLDTFFDSTTVRLPEGAYQLCLPFKDNLSALGDNENLARSRLHSLLAKLRKKEGHLLAADQEIAKSLQAGYAEKARPRGPDEMAHYLPLTVVFKYNAEGTAIKKTRICKDASAHTAHRPSLNQCLHQGSNLLPLIPAVLCAFRGCLFPVTADIQNAFLQFHLHPSNRTLLRFLWPIGISTDPRAPAQEFWSTRLEFGLSCSPWCHIKGVQHHLTNCEREFPTEVEFIREVSRNLYMDDIVFSANSVDEAKRKVETLIKMFQTAHFPLKKWSTHDEDIARAIARVSPISETEVTSGEADAKFLGVNWNQPMDEIGVFTSKALTTLRSGTTKRILLKSLASLYDPVGILCPVSIRAKIIFQSLWKKNLDWNDPLPADAESSYLEFANELEKCSDLKIRRALASRFPTARFELHVFCDASMEAYACAVYLRSIFDSHVETSLVFAKARVVPLKNKCSIHRYELMGAVLAARIAKLTRESLKLKIDRTLFWIDNMACVAWIHSGPDRWQAFVANRVRAIDQLTDRNDWFWVKSEDNPADIASRGTEISSVESRSRWLHGPSWLRRSDWTPPLQQAIDDTTEEAKGSPKCVFHTVPYNDSNVVDELISADRFSSWVKLLRTQAFCNRLLAFARAVKSGKSQCPRRARTCDGRSTLLRIQPDEYLRAEVDLIKRIQQRHFATELAGNCQSISKGSPLFQFHPFLDDQGIIRCRSRLERTKDLPFDTRFPILIPSNGGWAKLLVLYVHARDCWHWGGVAMTLQRLRERFFVLKARRITTAALRSCSGCRKFTARPAAEAVAPLPEFRIEEAPPYFFCGVDFAGPLYYKTEDGRKAKSYILLFTCAVTRAIHLELTSDMSTYEVLTALQRFIGRFPTAKNFFSDNGASFRRADTELKLIYEHIARGDLGEWLGRRQLSWRFIAPASPWVGGFWERSVGSVKRCLRRVLGTSIPYFRDLETILVGVAAIVNRRPLTTVSTDPNELTALTPANLVSGYQGDNWLPQTLEFPARRKDIGAVCFSKRWLFQQRVLAAFWERYRSEYLVYLRTAMQSKPVAQRSLQVGAVCLLKEDDKSRAFWPLVRITELHPGSDGKARSCTVKTSNGKFLVRPARLLYPLESINDDPLH